MKPCHKMIKLMLKAMRNIHSTKYERFKREDWEGPGDLLLKCVVYA